jgi:hypothetical protein
MWSAYHFPTTRPLADTPDRSWGEGRPQHDELPRRDSELYNDTLLNKPSLRRIVVNKVDAGQFRAHAALEVMQRGT